MSSSQQPLGYPQGNCIEEVTNHSIPRLTSTPCVYPLGSWLCSFHISCGPFAGPRGSCARWHFSLRRGRRSISCSIIPFRITENEWAVLIYVLLTLACTVALLLRTPLHSLARFLARSSPSTLSRAYGIFLCTLPWCIFNFRWASEVFSQRLVLFL